MINTASFSAFRGDTFSKTLTFKDSDGVAIDITGWTLWVTLKKSEDDKDEDAVVQEEVTVHSDPTHGITSFTISATETAGLLGMYYFDVQVKRSDDTILTLLKGKINFEKDITVTTGA